MPVTPPGGGWLPIDPDPPLIGDGTALFDQLGRGLPLLLLPVRIETRYRTDLETPELRIRVYPDQVHVDADTPLPGKNEYRMTVAFWQEWYASTDQTRRQAAWDRFFTQIGDRRAGYLARLLKPQRSGNQLEFPPFDERDRHRPAEPRLLPRRWIALGYLNGELIFQESGKPIKKNLRIGPNPKASVWTSEETGIEIDAGLAWMVDYGRAVEDGMAITVPLIDDAAAALDKVSRLLVVGIDTNHTEEDLTRLLDVHRRTGGFGFVKQGTATNNIAQDTTGWSNRPDTSMEEANRELSATRKVAGNAETFGHALGLTDRSGLARVRNGTDAERARSRAAVTVLFETVLGTYLRQLLDVGGQNAITPKATNDTRRWAINHLTGGAPLPTVRVGPQPYGILPVMRSRSTPVGGIAEGVETVLAEVVDEWRAAASILPTLNPNDTDVAGTQAHVENIGRILATQPHPARLFTRRLEDYNNLNFLEKLLTPQAYYAGVLASIDPDINTNIHSPQTEMFFFYSLLVNNAYYGITDQANSSHDVLDQIEIWQDVLEQTEEFLRSDGRPVEADEAVSICNHVISVLESYEQRQRPLRSLALNRFDGRLGLDNTTLVQGFFERDAPEWGDVGLVELPDAPAESQAADYLDDLRQRFQNRTGTTLGPSSMPTEFHDREPLLYQLLDATLGLVPTGRRMADQVVAALNLLATVDVAELEWLVRETLGLGTHRIDAWHTALASERLTNLRKLYPTGLNIGAFGWVTDLEPRGNRQLSDGFIHAPSMAHATTASILRAGWLSHGTTDPNSLAAVDLRSERIRTASWLLDGIRQGQDLGDLLGHRFERILHDTNGDRFIRPIRQQVLTAQDRVDVPPDEPVDGVVLLDLWRDGELSGQAPVVRRAINALAETFDAVRDVGLFESVHQLTLGNHDRATAMLETMTTGVTTPPDLRAPRSTRRSIGIDHRVLVMMPRTGSVGGGWRAGVRDSISPGLERWLARLIPSANQIGFTTIEPDGASEPLTLADLHLSALDAVYLVGDDPDRPGEALATIASARHHGGRSVTIDPRTRGAGPTVDLAEFSVLAVEIRRSLARWRPATARDFRRADDPGAADTSFAQENAEVSAALVALDQAVDDLHDKMTTEANPMDQREVLARYGVACRETAAADPDAAADVHKKAVSRLRFVADNQVDPADLPSSLAARAAALFGSPLPILGAVNLSRDLDGSHIRPQPSLADEAEIDGWLDDMGRVRAEVGRLTTLDTIGGLLTGNSGARLVAGQYPRAGGESWAATGHPAEGTGGRTSLVLVGAPGGGRPTISDTTSASAMFVDQWAERLPAKDVTTGVAFQFDAPSNRPPQSWLLAVPPDEEDAWSLRLVVETLLETLEWAELRTVGPEDLGDFGRAAPTVMAPGSIIQLPEEGDD
ncbi:MAG: hypothetical protein AAF531_03965 [Actinomycetota bacterium]